MKKLLFYIALISLLLTFASCTSVDNTQDGGTQDTGEYISEQNSIGLSEGSEASPDGVPSEEETLPEETLPEETLPQETSPQETSPQEILPQETLPGETLPQETLPEEDTSEAITEGATKNPSGVIDLPIVPF